MPGSSPEFEKHDALDHGVRDDSAEIQHMNGQEVTKGSRVTFKTQIVGAAITIGGFLFGYDIGVISGCLIMPDFYNRFGGEGLGALPTNNASLITALLSVGTFIGSLAQGPVSDAVGRKYSMMIWALFFTVGALIQTTVETSLAQIVVGRVIAGLGVGALSGLCPLYLGETAPANVRGTIISCYQLNIIFGIVISYGITWATSTRAADNSLSWRIPVGMQLLWGIMLITIMLFIPESPRWLQNENRPDEARKVMADMRGISLQPTGPNGELRGDATMEREYTDMADGIRAEKEAFAGTNWLTGWFVCFSTKQKMWYRTGLGMMLQTLQQLNGQNFYYYYGPTFFKAANVSLNPYQIQFIFGIVSFICTIPALYTIEKIGRRRGLLIGSFGEAACAFIVAFVGHYALAPENAVPTSGQKSAGNAFIAFAVLHLALFSCFWGPIPWTALGELYPSPLRARAISLGSASNWFWNFLLGFFSNKVAAQYGPFIMLIFGSILVVSGIFVALALPELRGLTLEQVDELFETDVKPWHSAEWVPQHGNTNRGTLGAGNTLVHKVA